MSKSRGETLKTNVSAYTADVNTVNLQQINILKLQTKYIVVHFH